MNKDKIRLYILEMIDLSNYEDTNASSVYILLYEMYLIFKGEKKEEIAERGEKDAFISWMRGIPSSFSVTHITFEQEFLLNDWGIKLSKNDNVSDVFYETVRDNVLNMIRLCR